MNLQNFSKFSEAIQTLNEQTNAYPINEAIKSSILRSISSIKGWEGWRGSFFKDFYKKFKVDLNEVSDSLFTTVDASTAKGMMKRKENVMIFCLYDNWQNPIKDKKSKEKYGVAITIMGSALYNNMAAHKGRYESRMGIGKWDRSYYMPDQYDKLGNFNYKHLVKICNEFIVLDIETMQAEYSTQDIIDTRQAQKQGSAHVLSNRDIRDENRKRYKEIMQAKIDPGAIMKEAQAVAVTIFTKLVDASSGTPEEFADSFSKDYKWEGWNNKLGDLIRDLGTELTRYVEDYARFLKAAREVEQEKKENPDSEYFYGTYELKSMMERFLGYRKNIGQLKAKAEAL